MTAVAVSRNLALVGAVTIAPIAPQGAIAASCVTVAFAVAMAIDNGPGHGDGHGHGPKLWPMGKAMAKAMAREMTESRTMTMVMAMAMAETMAEAQLAQYTKPLRVFAGRIQPIACSNLQCKCWRVTTVT